MSNVNVRRAVENIRSGTNVYTTLTPKAEISRE